MTTVDPHEAIDVSVAHVCGLPMHTNHCVVMG